MNSEFDNLWKLGDDCVFFLNSNEGMTYEATCETALEKLY